jgi:hypothetical protein
MPIRESAAGVKLSETWYKPAPYTVLALLVLIVWFIFPNMFANTPWQRTFPSLPTLYQLRLSKFLFSGLIGKKRLPTDVEVMLRIGKSNENKVVAGVLDGNHAHYQAISMRDRAEPLSKSALRY